MKKLLSVLLVVVLVLGVSCAGKPAPTEVGVIKYGLPVPLSGAAAPYGIGMLRAGELLAEDVNAAGGLEIGGKRYRIEIVAYDHKYDISQSVVVTKKLILEDKIKFLFPVGTACVAANAPYCEQQGVLSVAGATWAGDYKHTIFGFMSPDVRIDAYALMAKRSPEMKTVSFVAPNDETGRANVQYERTAAEAAGLRLSRTEMYERGTIDFMPLLQRILGDKPDMISVTGSPIGDAALMTKQARELGYKGEISGVSMLPESQVLVNIAGKEAAEGWIALGTMDEGLPPPMENVRVRYLQKYGPPWLAIAGQYYIFFEFVTDAIKAANSTDVEKVLSAMQNGEFETASGKTSLTALSGKTTQNQLAYPVPLTRLTDGKFVPIAWVLPRPK